MRHLLFLFLALTFFIPAAPISAEEGVRVYYTGPDDGVRQALARDESLTLTVKAAEANVYILNGSIPVAPALAAGVNEGAGLILILSPNTQLADIETLLRVPVTLTPRNAPLSLSPAPGASDSLLTEIAWASAPPTHERYVMEGFSVTPLVTGAGDGALVVGMGQVGAGRVFILTTPLGASNVQLQEWAYFNYFIHHLAMRAAGQTPQTYAAYSAVPLPRAILVGVLAVGALIALATITLVRRKKTTRTR